MSLEVFSFQNIELNIQYFDKFDEKIKYQVIIMVSYKYINGERYILGDHNEAKKRAFNKDIQDSLNKMMGSCTAEEKNIKAK